MIERRRSAARGRPPAGAASRVFGRTGETSDDAVRWAEVVRGPRSPPPSPAAFREASHRYGKLRPKFLFYKKVEVIYNVTVAT